MATTPPRNYMVAAGARDLPLELVLKKLEEHPGEFGLCRATVSYESEYQEEYFLKPEVVAILSDLASHPKGRKLTRVEILLINDSPSGLSEEFPDAKFKVSKAAKTATYDFLYR